MSIATALGLTPAVASAWVETSIKSYAATVDVDAEGRALVSHELVMGVRGGPLKRIEVPGIDADAEALPDGTVTPTVAGAASLPLLLERRDDGVLVLEVDHEKGLRSGRYAFVFRHRTDLRERGMIQLRGSHAELRWVSPHFDQGIDSMRILLRLPPSATAPALPSYDDKDPEAPFGAFIGNLRRTPDKDELEIVRPHVARGEPVVWRADVSPTLVAAAAPPAEVTPAPGVAKSTRGTEPAQRLEWWGIAGLVALAYGLLVSLKAYVFGKACDRFGGTSRALVPLPIGVRAPLAGLSLAGALVASLRFDQPTGAALLLLLSLACAALRAPALRPQPRGPGQWLPLKEGEAFAGVSHRLPGRYLDACSLPGFVLFALGVSCSVAASGWLLQRSPYEALLALLFSAVLLPIFSTGRAVDLPAHPLAHASLLRKLARQLKRRPSTRVLPWARVSAQSGRPDELRILVQPKPCPVGLLAIELGVESLRGVGGAVASPYALLRVKEGAGFERCLPRSAVWTRGRKADERVAILRPQLPTARSLLALTLELLKTIESAGEKPRNQPISRPSSGGSTERTAKLGRFASPAHAT